MADHVDERIKVAARPDECWAIATDYESYPEWVRDVKHAAILERDGEGRGTRVQYRAAALGKSIRYVLVYDYADAPHAFSWRFAEGEILRRLDGTYRFDPVEPDSTRVHYTLLVELAVPLPGLIKRRAASLIMGNALRELKRRIEGG